MSIPMCMWSMGQQPLAAILQIWQPSLRITSFALQRLCLWPSWGQILQNAVQFMQMKDTQGGVAGLPKA